MSQFILTHASRRLLTSSVLLLLMCVSTASNSQTISTAALLTQLQKGGLVIVMRHASSPLAAPDKATANRDNTKQERQLDDTGRATATEMGKALRKLRIRMGTILSSPTYRALETIKLAGLPTPRTYPELGDGGKSMQDARAAQAEWLQKQVALFPKGTDTLIVTHMPNISAAFPQHAAVLSDGEALIFGPDGKGGSMFLARIKIDEWPKLSR